MSQDYNYEQANLAVPDEPSSKALDFGEQLSPQGHAPAMHYKEGDVQGELMQLGNI